MSLQFAFGSGQRMDTQCLSAKHDEHRDGNVFRRHRSLPSGTTLPSEMRKLCVGECATNATKLLQTACRLVRVHALDGCRWWSWKLTPHLGCIQVAALRFAEAKPNAKKL